MLAFGLRFQGEQGADETFGLGGASRVAVERRLEITFGMTPAADFKLRVRDIRTGEEAAVVGGSRCALAMTIPSIKANGKLARCYRRPWARFQT
jgi:hypothetical protein